MSQSSTEQTRDVINAFMQALTNRNLQNILAQFAKVVDWYIPGNSSLAPWLGRRHNRQEIELFYELLWKNTEPVSVKVDTLLIENNAAIIGGEFSTKMLQTENVVNSLFFISIVVENNRIVKYHLLEDSYAVHTALTK